MVKKKVKDASTSEDELSIPIPIQTFLWRQTSPFIRSRLTKLCEASCVSFERVIVQNILHGLSPSLCEAIQSIPRWKFVRASLPHVIHCCAAVLKNRSETNSESKFNSIEVKLLYTLHWIILDAAGECEDSESGRPDQSRCAYLHSLDTIQLFVFLLVPLVSSLRRSDFENLKLENGLRLWEPLWNFQQPNVSCFSRPVKTKQLHFKPQNEVSKVNFNMANIYLGQGTSSEDLFSESKEVEPFPTTESSDTLSRSAPLVQMSDICALSNRNSMEESATSMKLSSSNEPGKSTEINFNLDPNLIFKTSKISESNPKLHQYDVLSATYMDIAVLQCLFCPQWDEEGINWSLQYILKRLTDIKLEMTRIKKLKQLSQSMPNLDLCKENETKIFPRKDSASVEALLASCSFPQATFTTFPTKNSTPSKVLPSEGQGVKNLIDGSTLLSSKPESFGSFNSASFHSGKKESPTSQDGKPQKPIITITCDNSKPPSSYSWPMKKVVEIVSESSKNQGDLTNNQHDNLQRSLTDSKIHYTNNEETCEASGSTCYIQADGQLKYSVILLAIYNLSSRHMSSRVCYIIIDLINCFEDLNFFKKSHKDDELVFRKAENSENNNLDRSQSSLKKCKKSEDESMFSMTMDILFRVFRAIGCVHGCSDCSLKISSNLRGQVFECLEKLMEINLPLFKKYIVSQFLDQPLPVLMECLHVLLGYCSDTINIYHIGGSKRESGFEFHSGLGYSNNFGEPSSSMNSIQNRIIVLIWKELLVKFVDCEKEILAHENIHLYHEIKQLVNYMKDNNGSTFRCVALSFLMDAMKPSENPEILPGTKSDEDKDGHVFNATGCAPCKSKSIFKKKTKKHSFQSHMSCAENTCEDQLAHQGHISPRASIFSIADDDVQFLAKKKSVRMFRGFHKSPKSDNEEDFSNGESLVFAKGQRMSFKATGQATLRLLSARRKLEDGFKSFGRKHAGKRESICEGNLFGNGMSHGATQFLKNSNLVREKKLINSYVLKSGLVRFNFLQEFCNPGSLPDAPLVAALLDLEAPILGRAALLLECAHFVNRCNKGDWPNWMKLSYGGLCTIEKNHSSQQSISGRNVSVQKNAGILFHQWAEMLGSRLSEVLIDENPDFYSFMNKVGDDGKKQDPRHADQEENYLDEESVNQGGNECPHSLKLVACQLLYEITAYLRETHQNLPTIKRQRYERVADNKNDPNRRWSSVFTPPESGEFPSSNRPQEGSDRKISFAVLDVTTRSDSMHSSTNSISQSNTNSSLDPKPGRKSMISSGQKLLKARRGSDQNATFKHNRSFKVTHHAQEGLPRVGSTKHRKVSTQSLHSANSTEETVSSSYAIFEEEENEEAQNFESDHSPGVSYEDKCLGDNMPWVKVVVQLANKSNFVCDHQNVCHLNCYERQRRSCTRLMLALRKVYNSMEPQETHVQSVKVQTNKPKQKDSSKSCHSSSSNHHSSTKSTCSSDPDPGHAIPNKHNEALLIMKYLDQQVANLTHNPLAVVAKAAPILSDDIFIDIMPVAWELLLESDQELAAAAASVFLLSSIRVPEHMQELISYQFQHPDASFRIGATLRFSILWNFRFQVWHRMEEGAHYHFKIPPPNIDFVLPSPTIGLASLPTVDAPWLPHFKTKVEEVTINQKESNARSPNSLKLNSRLKMAVEQLTEVPGDSNNDQKKATTANDTPSITGRRREKRVARENCFMTSVPICLTASIEPALLHSSEDHEDALQEELSLAVATRRMSVAVVNRASNVRNLSGRHGSVFFCRPMQVEDDERTYPLHSNQMHLAQSFFPSSICQSAINIIQCLDDFEVNSDGTSVSEVAEKIIWKCLVEDPALFLRTFLEKLTNKVRHKELIFLLRKLLWHVPVLPSQAAHCIFNYLIGFVMFHVRSPSEGGLESINEALSVVWQVVPCVTGIYFKDLKQTLRKEQCDSTLLIAANVPSAKKLIVHGPDLSCIPSQFLIQEDTQFYHVLQESLDFFNIPVDVQHEYFLVDTKTNHMHNLNCYVRDFYFFRRNFYPQLSLVRMDVDEAKSTLERQTFMLKFLEMEKVLFSLAVLNSSQGSQFQNHVNYLHEELLKLPSFPRKALETEFFTHAAGMKDEILQMDMLHKFSWAQLIATMFRGISSTITHVGDLPLFLNVINGIIVLHADDIFLLRHMAAIYINVCRHFKQVFSMTGFSFILPTILKVYTSCHSNRTTNHVIKFMFRQFFLLHRNSFILQLFGIASSMLENNKTSDKMETGLFYDLLASINEDLPDEMMILELMDDKQPIQALDFCYKDDPDTFSMMEAVNLCITVIAHSVESLRAAQMLTILETILPHFLGKVLNDHQKNERETSANDELLVISNLSILIKILVNSCETMTRFNRSQFEPNTKPLQGHLSQSPKPKKHKEDLTDFRFVPTEEGSTNQFQEFVKPRNAVLSIASDFYLPCLIHSRELHNSDPSIKVLELLDHKSHIRLADIAHSLLKVSAHDPSIISCVGLQKYMANVMPNTDWSQTSIRPALNLILRRLERFLNKIYKKMIPLNNLNWDAVTSLILAINSTLANCSFIGHLPQMKTLVQACMNIVMGDDGLSNTGSSYSLPHRFEANATFRSLCPLQFHGVSIKLALRLLFVLRESLEQLCESSASMYSSVEKLMNVIINIIFPSSLELSNHKIKLDCMVPRKADVMFCLSIILCALNPNFKHLSSRGEVDGRGLIGITSTHGSGSHLPPENFTKVVFLALKIVMICFGKELSSEWHKIAKVIVQMVHNRMGGMELWSFMDFVISHRGPLFVLLLPLIRHRLTKGLPESSHKYHLVDAIRKKLTLYHASDKKCPSTILQAYAQEMIKLKDENLSSSGFTIKTEEDPSYPTNFNKLEQVDQSKSHEASDGPEGKHQSLAHSYKNTNVIKPSDGNLILDKYFKDMQNFRNVNEGYELDSNSPSKDSDVDIHRLQRQDAKSRKTFKIKRHCSTLNKSGFLGGSILRSATVKGAGCQNRFQMGQIGKKDAEDRGSQKLIKTNNNELNSEAKCTSVQEVSMFKHNERTQSSQSDTDALASKKQHKQSVYRSRFMQKSKSHEDDAPAGTARGKIARQGLKNPQQSPAKASENDVLLAKSESSESLKDEKSYLLDFESPSVDVDAEASVTEAKTTIQ